MFSTVDPAVNSPIVHFLFDESGQACVEYAVVIAFFAIALVSSMQTLGSTAASRLSATQSNLAQNAVRLP